MVWIFSLSPSSLLNTHTVHVNANTHSDKFHFNFIMGWSGKQQAGRGVNVFWERFTFNIKLTEQTNTAMVFHMPGGALHFNASRQMNYDLL